MNFMSLLLRGATALVLLCAARLPAADVALAGGTVHPSPDARPIANAVMSFQKSSRRQRGDSDMPSVVDALQRAWRRTEVVCNYERQYPLPFTRACRGGEITHGTCEVRPKLFRSCISPTRK